MEPKVLLPTVVVLINTGYFRSMSDVTVGSFLWLREWWNCVRWGYDRVLQFVQLQCWVVALAGWRGDELVDRVPLSLATLPRPSWASVALVTLEQDKVLLIGESARFFIVCFTLSQIFRYLQYRVMNSQWWDWGNVVVVMQMCLI